jgi:hypothetical protein
MLRAVGAFLDEEPSCRITVAEVPDGFIVRMQRTVHKLEPQIHHFKRDTLNEQIDQLMRQRKDLGTRPHHQGVWSYFPNGHQDFLRALGYELDDSHAHGVLIDELEDGIIVTYRYPESDGSTWRKRLVVLGVKDIEEILNTAFERRKSQVSAEK